MKTNTSFFTFYDYSIWVPDNEWKQKYDGVYLGKTKNFLEDILTLLSEPYENLTLTEEELEVIYHKVLAEAFIIEAQAKALLSFKNPYNLYYPSINTICFDKLVLLSTVKSNPCLAKETLYELINEY